MDAGHAAHAVESIVEELHVAYSVLPPLVVAVPLIGALLVLATGKRWPRLRNALVVGVTGLTLLLVVVMIGPVVAEHRIGAQLPALLGQITFTVDAFGLLFALFTTFVWFASTLYSLDYLKHEHAHDRYHATSLIVLAANLGVVLAGDLVTLYLFFEALGLVAFLLVIHTETDEAKRASMKYWWMTIVGGFALLAGIMLTFALGGTGALRPLPASEGAEALRWAASALLILGFGVKAGMLPVHVWLPDAHPVAPSPASALLSGVMIKAGAYGIFRTLFVLMRPEISASLEESAWHFSSQLGLVVLWTGMATMLIGVLLALGQSNAKRMLAYHSVSQMGFILAGLGAAAYLGTHGAMGIGGALYHVVNHAIFKGALFLGVGAVFYRTAELDMYKLGGLWKRMPLTFLFTLIAAFGITGVPLFNGFVSKCMIHHAIVEAGELHELASLGVAEWIFIITCGGTACSFIKLIGFVFLGKAKQEYGPEVREVPLRMLLGMGMLSGAIVVLGVAPQLLLRGLFVPGLESWGLHATLLEKYLETMFLSAADLQSLIIPFVLGALIFIVGKRFGLFHLHAPAWFGVDYWYCRAAHGLISACAFIDEWYEHGRSSLSRWLSRTGVAYAAAWVRLDRQRHRFVTTLLTGAPGPRNQRFVQHAYVELERERQATVRQAIDALTRDLDAGDRPTGEREALIDAGRHVALYMSGRVFTERMGVVSDIVRFGLAEEIREGFDSVVEGLVSSREEVAETVLHVAPKRVAGQDVNREISAGVNRLIGQERFDRRLATLVPPRGGHLPGADPRTAASTGALAHLYRSEGLSRLERFARWLSEITRLAVESVTQERASWAFENRFDEASVVSTRVAIQRYARDMSFNVAVIFVVLLAFLGALAVRA
ncbi:MAG: complex I subunit 5 family protein [Coriobacteriia bacterium]|nr:complex I subunit 5 family protein [Coriobacteriia bacterium]